MTSTGLFFIIIAAVICFTAPRRYVLLPLFASVLWMTQGQGIEIFELRFYALRLITLLIIVRILVRREYPVGGWTVLDKTVLLWASMILATSIFHKPELFSIRLGMIYNFAAPYLVFRCVLVDFQSVRVAALIAVLVFLPMSFLLVLERHTGRNSFSLLGGVAETSATRDGKIRAQGPFGHPINAGVAGVMTAGLSLLLWPSKRKTALLGLSAGGAAIYASSSGGPVLAGVVIMCVALFYPWRAYTRRVVWAWLLCLIALQVVMNAPVWYLIARVKVFGGSTAWHRSELINSSVKYFNEWWLAGTDYTRHWTPSGLDQVNPDSADITSEYVWMMVAGGLGLFLTFVSLLVNAFRCVGKLRLDVDEGRCPGVHPFEPWALFGLLLTISVTFLTISYFDQVKIYWSFTLAAVSSWCASQVPPEPTDV